MAKSKGKTGFRNGDLFCYNCGGSYKMQMPQPVSMATAIMTQFQKDHSKCAPVWKEPVNESAEAKSEIENANWWVENGEHGSSSKTIFNHLKSLGRKPIKNDFPQPPSDPDDFRRCYLLLKAVPQWKNRLNELKSISPVWSNLVDNWQKLTEMLEEQFVTQKDNGMYDLMKSLGC